MNKKLIAIAIATAMAAPVAMADIKISGRVGLHYTSLDNDAAAAGVTNTDIGDEGHARIQFDGTVGKAFARIAYDGRGNAGIGATRDNYVGYKFDGFKFQMGRMATAGKNLEKDPYIATFLETRKSIGNSYTASQYGSNGFVDNLMEVSFKAGSAKVKIQADLTDTTNLAGQANGKDNEGHIAASVTGKAGGVRWWASYNNGSADGDNNPANTTSPSNIKVGASMKFGKVKTTLNYTSKDTDVANGATDSILLMADMGLGNGLSVNAAFATRSGDVAAQDATYIRLAVAKKLNKGTTAYAGYTTTDNDTANTDTSEIGVGLTVKF